MGLSTLHSDRTHRGAPDEAKMAMFNFIKAGTTRTADTCQIHSPAFRAIFYPCIYLIGYPIMTGKALVAGILLVGSIHRPTALENWYMTEPLQRSAGTGEVVR